jgi:hypothetical protein
MALPALKRSKLREWFDGDPVYKPITARRQPKFDAMLEKEKQAAEQLIAMEAGEEPPTTSDGKKSKVKPSQFVTQPQVSGLKITPNGITMPKIKAPKLKQPKMPKVPQIKIP